jgi:hypothetical protein
MEMKCILNIEKKNSILAKATQVSDVAHGPLVISYIPSRGRKDPRSLFQLLYFVHFYAP